MSGIQTHSSLAANETYVIFATDSPAKWIETLVSRAGAVPLTGCYKGKTERAYIINSSQWSSVQVYCRKQESILILGPIAGRFPADHRLAIDGLRPATLHYLNGELPVSLGYFQQVPWQIAEAQDGWTYDYASKTYWACSHSRLA